jgi:hypothetical protein
MKEHIDEFVLFVLALDEDVSEFIVQKNDESLKVLNLTDIEDRYPELLEAKANRSIVEYYFTLSPVLPLFILETYKEIDFITTLDADVYFFRSPEKLFKNFDDYSILITAHDFSKELAHLNIYGKYNVSFQSFRRDEIGIKCLKKWKEQCINWCYDRFENEKFADQKYLDSWVNEFDKVLEIKGGGAGIAPWNVSKYKFKKLNNTIYCNDSKLIFYHFHGLRYLNSKVIKHGLHEYQMKMNYSLKELVYKKYIETISNLNELSNPNDNNISRYYLFYSKVDIGIMLLSGQALYFLLNTKLMNMESKILFKILSFILRGIKYIK